MITEISFDDFLIYYYGYINKLLNNIKAEFQEGLK